MSSIFNVIYLIATSVSAYRFFKNNDRSYVLNNKLSYEEETEEEMNARKLKSYTEKMTRKAINAGYLDENGKPDIEAYKQLLKEKEEEKRKRKEENRFSFGAFFKYLFTHSLPGSAPTGSEDWEASDWGRYIANYIESSANINYGTTIANMNFGHDFVEIRVRFSPISGLSKKIITIKYQE